jgi:hypothetical protein
MLGLSIVTAAWLGFAAADCQFDNTIGQGGSPDPPSADKMCLPQGEGSWTFSMYNSAVEVPTFNGGDPNAGYAGNTAFVIYDNTCNPMAIYGMPTCGTPYTAIENFLPLVLTVVNIDTQLGGEYFQFTYGNGEYEIKNNGCVCSDMSDGLQGATGCRCAFPLNGDFMG